MKALIAQLLSADEDTFEEQLCSFLRLGPPARNAALSWLRSSEPLHRKRACDVLAEVQKRPMGEGIEGLRAWDVDHTPIPHLIHVLENDRDGDVRCAAARALKFHKLPQTIPPLLRAARSDDPDICYWVASALSSFHTYPEELRPLIPAAHQIMLRLLDSPDDDTRDWAAHSAQCDAFNTPAINAALLRLTRDKCRFVRGEAISSLAHHGDQRVIPAIRSALRGTTDTTLWFWLFEGIVKMQAVELIPDLLACKDKDALEAAQELQRNL